VAKGIAYANDTPIIELNSLEIIAHEARSFQLLRYEYYYPMIDARRMEVYSASFDSMINCLQTSQALILTDINIIDHFNISNSIFLGSGAEKLQFISSSNMELNINHQISATARAMLSPAMSKYQKREFVNTAYFEPFYLKPFYTTLKKSK
jgi:tRNA threonylcarbamoyladenosine biosynthesis protein TsaB